MTRKPKSFTKEEADFFAGFVDDMEVRFQNRVRKALQLAMDIRAFMPGLPGHVQDDLHNAAYSLEQWAESQK